MSLRLDDADQRRVDALDADVRAAAEAVGIGLAGALQRLAPRIRRPDQADEPAPGGVLVALELEHEGPADPVAMCACMAAHGTYVRARGAPDGISTGALAIARLLAWAQRAAMLGRGPRVLWVGPASRRPEPAAGQHALWARCRVRLGHSESEARAAALIEMPPG